MLDDRGTDPAGVERVLLCSGKIYYELDVGREERARDDVAIVRLEQLYPFPAAELTEILTRYPHAGEFCWVQEEPENRARETSSRCASSAAPRAAALALRGALGGGEPGDRLPQGP